MKKLTDSELIKAYMSGDSCAMQIILERYKTSVYNYILHKVQKEDVAEDIFQDTFMKIILTLNEGRYNEEGKFISWIMRIAHNMVIDYFRNKNKYHFVSETTYQNEEFTIFDFLFETELSYEDSLIREQTLKDIVKLLDKLLPEQKEIVEMRIFKNYSFKDIAEELDISINTCLGRMRYALINLRKFLEQNKIFIDY